jgi:hypothetical protein
VPASASARPRVAGPAAAGTEEVETSDPGDTGPTAELSPPAGPEAEEEVEADAEAEADAESDAESAVSRSRMTVSRA